jgi:hypothetical protein
MEGKGEVKSLHFNPKDETALTEILNRERAMRLEYPAETMETHLQKLSDTFGEAGKPPEKAEKTVTEKPKPKTLEEKLNAAKEKVKAQDAQTNKNKSRKREERE